MELKTYIQLMNTASYLRGVAKGCENAWLEEIAVKAAGEIEEAIAANLPWELRK